MKKAYVGAVAVTAGILAFSAAPAIAATDSGTVSCGSVRRCLCGVSSNWLATL